MIARLESVSRTAIDVHIPREWKHVGEQQARGYGLMLVKAATFCDDWDARTHTEDAERDILIVHVRQTRG